MATQWGRDNSFQPRRGSAGPIILVAILSVAVGFAGGYMAFRYLQPDLFTQQDISAPLDQSSTDIARLNEALSAAMNDLEVARAAQAASASEVLALKAQTARQAADLDAMAEKLAAVSSEAQAPGENAEALANLNRERDALTAANETLRSNLAALEAERDSLRQEAAEVERRLTAELARLNDQVLPDLTEERDQLQRRISALLEDQNALEAHITAAARTRASDETRIAALEARLAQAARELATAREALAMREAGQEDRPAGSEPESNPDAAGTPAIPDPAADTRDDRQPVPRDPEAVAAALRSAPGIGLLTEGDLRILTERLVSGECVTTALESVFDRVPILTLRNLIRDLNSDC
ncbi:hypothetical protein [Hoeflea sp.]|uniref:hypothetical protein n=1 Tax=Hoeflea sp. TaxID=1940281 RepID=UPI0019BD3CA4|nr:hypothetical protein [Hoeflea sp.]MBC7283065.1 hypothetical protein [Hoeflea sp.]